MGHAIRTVKVSAVWILLLNCISSQTLGELSFPGFPGGTPNPGGPPKETCDPNILSANMFLDGHYDTKRVENGFNFEYKAPPFGSGNSGFGPNDETSCLPNPWDNTNPSQGGTNKCDGKTCDFQLGKGKAAKHPASVTVTIKVEDGGISGPGGKCHGKGDTFTVDVPKGAEVTRISKNPCSFIPGQPKVVTHKGPMYHLTLKGCEPPVQECPTEETAQGEDGAVRAKTCVETPPDQ